MKIEEIGKEDLKPWSEMTEEEWKIERERIRKLQEAHFKKTKTVIFEEKYNVNINNFSTTDEIDKVIEKKIGRKLKMVNLDNHGI